MMYSRVGRDKESFNHYQKANKIKFKRENRSMRKFYLNKVHDGVSIVYKWLKVFVIIGKLF